MSQTIDIDLHREGPAGLETEEMTLNMGPQHPSTHGVLRFVVKADGEVMRRAIPDIGYLHRSIEKIAEKVGYHGFMPYTDRVDYVSATDEEALEAFKLCAKLEGILPALEPAHALAEVIKRAPRMGKDKTIVMNMCGRGDKDVFAIAERFGVTL